MAGMATSHAIVIRTDHNSLLLVMMPPFFLAILYFRRCPNASRRASLPASAPFRTTFQSEFPVEEFKLPDGA
jgi:hypothetical protein